VTFFYYWWKYKIDVEMMFGTRITKLRTFPNVFSNACIPEFYQSVELFQVGKNSISDYQGVAYRESIRFDE
jgi:hypothetical protein